MNMGKDAHATGENSREGRRQAELEWRNWQACDDRGIGGDLAWDTYCNRNWPMGHMKLGNRHNAAKAGRQSRRKAARHIDDLRANLRDGCGCTISAQRADEHHEYQNFPHLHWHHYSRNSLCKHVSRLLYVQHGGGVQLSD